MQPDPGRWMAVGRGIGQVSLAAFLFFLIGFRKLQQNAKP
jgi:hypothetical protein